MGKSFQLILVSAISVIGLYFFFMGLTEAKGFLAPLTTAVILALLLMPVSRKLENWKMNRLFASLASTTGLLLITFGIIAVVSLQIKGFIEDWDTVKKNMEPKIENFQQLLYKHTSIDEKQVEKYKDEYDISSLLSTGESSKKAIAFVNSLFTFVTDAILVFIYVFFLVYYRSRFKQFLLMLFSKEKQKEAKEILSKTTKVGQDYLLGKLILIGFLSILYSIGLGVSGVNNFILVSIIAAFLTLIPFIGNIIGMVIAIAFGFVIHGETGVLIGIIITFTIVQFVESYIFEPYVVGDKVDIHPFFVILAIILGNMVWGVIGMILAIPVFGILNVTFRHIKMLHPFGFLFSNDKVDSKA